MNWRTEPQAGGRMMEMIPMPMELIVIDTDKQAACDLIGNDTYGVPHWTVETIPESNRVVQAFARHRIASLAATPTKPLAVEADEVERRKFYKSDWPLGRLLEARDRGLVLDDGEAWRYQYTHKDAKGEYDLLYRPISPDQTTDEFDRLVKAFRAAPLNGDAGCDKLTDDEWRIVAQAALKAMKNG